MDLETLENNLNAGCYPNKDKFVKSLRKIFENARTYNRPNTIYYKTASDIENSLDFEIKNLKEN